MTTLLGLLIALWQFGGSPPPASAASLGLVIGTNVQAYDADLTQYATATPSAFMLSVFDDANIGTLKASLDLEPGVDYQSADSDLSTYASITPGANVQTMLGSANNAAILSNIGAQAGDATLTAFGGGTCSNDRLIYCNGSDTVGSATFTAAGRALVDDADAAAQLTTLGVGATVQTLFDDGSMSDVRTTLGLGTFDDVVHQGIYGSGFRKSSFRSVAFGDSPVTVLADDFLIFCNPAGGDVTINLPAVDFARELRVKRTTAANKCVLDGSGGEDVEGADTFDVDGTPSGVVLHNNGVAWFIVSSRD